ncbi:acetyltransferase (GNAT) domain protein (plasmid) [Pseudosulfitobacter pseudonitzschiae]|uniref:Acetyltransferase (GNAT) domain protein n=1 Tax=Pseudosulfitobacter pseudonitzschiae TaxID=1402135 RepID=A0A221K6I5_9RHOB|nr:GNAT family N-acetyltransferase [Sulfitobacter sp. DFL-23]ASM74624.1 acetyltransferase (GNAT) domain protein [Pseudosulfitobacter pseudonitzschiae]
MENVSNVGQRYDDCGRVYLRRLTPEDVTDIYIEWFRDSVVTEFLNSRNLNQADVTSYIVEGAEKKIHYMYGIFDDETDRHIGNIKVGPIQWDNLVSDLVCVIGDRNYWGKGLAKEAIRLGNRVAFDVHGMRKVSGGIASGNIGSIKAYTGADWVIEATMSGHHLIDGKPQDRIVVSCFNPEFFPDAPVNSE